MQPVTLSARSVVILPDADLEYHTRALTIHPVQSSVALEGDTAPPPVELLGLERETADGTVCTVPRFYALAECPDSWNDVRLQQGDPLHGDVQFRGTLSDRTAQKRVHRLIVDAWSSGNPREHGVLAVLPCGFGKTVLALACVAARGHCALIVVPNSILVNQWRERAATFLPRATIAELRGGVWNSADRVWFLANQTRDDVESQLCVRDRTVEYSATRAVRVRCKALLDVRLASPCPAGVTLEWDGSSTAFTLRGPPDQSVRVALRERIAQPYAEVQEVCDGVALLFRKDTRARAWPAALRDAAVPGMLFPQSLRDKLSPWPCVDGAYPDIVVTTAQTLSMHTPPPVATEACGVLVADEVHSFCARVFSTALSAVPCARILALSATPERPDNLHVALPMLVGREVARVERSWQHVAVRRVTYRDGEQSEIKLPNGRLMLAQMLSRLAQDDQRTDAIAQVVSTLVNEEGRHVLLLTERVDHVAALAGAIESRAALATPCGQMHGGTSATDRAAAATRQVIVATYPLCRQGFDVPRLDTLVMATPVTAVEQAIGRVLRVHPDKPDPLVVDVVDPFSIFAGEARKRGRFYDDNGYEVTDEELPRSDRIGSAVAGQ